MPPVCVIVSAIRNETDDNTNVQISQSIAEERARELESWTLLPYYQELNRNMATHTSKAVIKFITEISNEGDRHEMFMNVVIDHSNPVSPRLKQIHHITRKKYNNNNLISYDKHKSLKQAVFRYISPYPWIEWTSMRLGANTYGIHAIIFRAIIKRIKYIETNLM